MSDGRSEWEMDLLVRTLFTAMRALLWSIVVKNELC